MQEGISVRAHVTQRFESVPSHEPAVVITERELKRMIQRLKEYGSRGWADLRLAFLGVGVG
jgi:hypothetical protein